jgi:hypothetical protein
MYDEIKDEGNTKKEKGGFEDSEDEYISCQPYMLQPIPDLVTQELVISFLELTKRKVIFEIEN